MKKAALLVSATALTTALAATPVVADMHRSGAARAAASSGANTAASADEFGAMSWIYVGTYRTKSACEADGRSSIYADWACKPNPSSGKWQLWVDDES
ncbi:hypothetical protein AB0N81_11435 [Streptomyces sp. NPDC093510]|uniref:hypothetical protein n=1 Tax=Streptomyces sp. NPDC093510 TaxID=3155199 RepID=UPI00343C4275